MQRRFLAAKEKRKKKEKNEKGIQQFPEETGAVDERVWLQ